MIELAGLPVLFGRTGFMNLSGIQLAVFDHLVSVEKQFLNYFLQSYNITTSLLAVFFESFGLWNRYF